MMMRFNPNRRRPRSAPGDRARSDRADVSRPFGTYPPRILNPTLKRWAIFGGSAGFQTCCAADFQISRSWKRQDSPKFARAAGLETGDTPDLEVRATTLSRAPS